MPKLDGSLPSSLKARSRYARVGPDVPALVVRPEESADGPAPVTLRMVLVTQSQQWQRWQPQTNMGNCAKNKMFIQGPIFSNPPRASIIDVTVAVSGAS